MTLLAFLRDPRLVLAEALKLRKRRGLMIWSLVLTTGAVVVFYGVLAILHAANPTHHGPAGGAVNLLHVVQLLGGLGSVAAIILGSTAGSQDVSAGVFRDLVVTGRPRRQLFLARWWGAVLVYLPLLALAFGLLVLGGYALAGSLPAPSASGVGSAAAWLAAHTLVNLGLAVGLGSVLSSRITVGVILAWNAAVAPLLAQIKLLGRVRVGIDVVAANHLDRAIDQGQQSITMSNGTAVVVLVVWVALFLLLGAWWTERRDA